MEGAATSAANYDDRRPACSSGWPTWDPALITAGDRGFVPLLARSWTRRDSLTLVFDLDPRARWHDGAPVTARDVVFTFERARDPDHRPAARRLLRRIASVTAEGDRRVVFRFAAAYAEQFYDATFHVAPLPAHLLDSIPPDRLAPVGVRGAAGRQRPLPVGPPRAGSVHRARREPRLLPRPAQDRAGDRPRRREPGRPAQPAARAARPTRWTTSRRRSEHRAGRGRHEPAHHAGAVARPWATCSSTSATPATGAGPTRSWPTRDVRRAIALALDRQLMVRQVLGQYGDVPYGPVSPLLWIRHGAPAPARQNLAEARRLLAGRGWVDRDGDGMLDRDGHPLALDAQSSRRPAASAGRWRRWSRSSCARSASGSSSLQLDVAGLASSGAAAGDFDIDFSSASQDPSPTGLTQSWSCTGAEQRRPVLRSGGGLADRAGDRRPQSRPRSRGTRCCAGSRRTRRRSSSTRRAYMYAREPAVQNVTIRPESAWIALWRWSVEPGAGPPAAILSVRRWLLRRALQALVTLRVAVVAPVRPDARSRPAIRCPAMRRAPRRHAGGDRRAPRALRTRPAAARPVRRLPRRRSSAATSASRSSTAARSPPCSPSGCPPPSCSAAPSSCSTSPSASGSACGRRCAGARRETAGSPTLSLAGYAMPSFWLGLVLAWLVGVEVAAAARRAACRIRCSTADAGWLARAGDVAAPPRPAGPHAVGGEHRGHHALPAGRHARGPPPSLYSDRPGQGAPRAAGAPGGTPGGTRCSRSSRCSGSGFRSW